LVVVPKSEHFYERLVLRRLALQVSNPTFFANIREGGEQVDEHKFFEKLDELTAWAGVRDIMGKGGLTAACVDCRRFVPEMIAKYDAMKLWLVPPWASYFLYVLTLDERDVKGSNEHCGIGPRWVQRPHHPAHVWTLWISKWIGKEDSASLIDIDSMVGVTDFLKWFLQQVRLCVPQALTDAKHSRRSSRIDS